MEAIIACCYLLLTSVCAWPQRDTAAAEPEINNNHTYGIFGGSPIRISEVPYMAQFKRVDQPYWCGAAIISAQFLISAAHCVQRDYSYTVIVGSDVNSQGTTYQVQTIYVHPNNDPVNQNYDLAVIKLTGTIAFSNTVQPITMADSSMMPSPGEMMQTMGFGKTPTVVESNILLGVQLPYVDPSTCAADYGSLITRQMICAGGQQGIGTCHGDSGSPLVYRGKLIGVVSWGPQTCASQNKPSVFAYIPSMQDFISRVINTA